MCLTSDNDCETAKTLFTAIESKFGKNSLSWNNCVGRNVENNNIMIGKHNSKASNTLKKNPSIFIGGCPCHLADVTTSHAHDSFLEVLRVNTENLCIDLHYWFDKSSKRKGNLAEYFKFCDQTYKSIL